MEKSSGGGVRLHVGGLGETVGRDDLLKIFSPMGTVDAVEFVRTKGRSFAYIDFSPSSSNSLTKLFSTYNGCVWKGGRLRLEKAKEHYLARLKREWEEEASASVETIKAPSDSTPSTHINIFFPRLRKVKAMPLSGTGKHKYSFQRVQVPSLPKSFCDCDEHSNSLTPRETHVRDLEALNVGVNEEEVNVMNSVMNKLFEKNNIPINEQVPEEDSEIEADQDNLVINVVSKGNDMGNSMLDMLSRKRKSILHETTANGEEYSEGPKGKNIHPSKKMKSIIPEGSERQEESSKAIRDKKKPSEVLPDKSSDEPSRTAAVKRSIDNVSWSQKSSWKALMANGNSSDFSVSSVLPGVGSSKAVRPASHNTDVAALPIHEKSKKTKSKRVTSTIMTEDLPVSDDDIERDDSDSVSDDDVERDDSDSLSDDDVERDDSDAVSDDDIERDDSDSVSDTEVERDDSDAVSDDDVERDDSDAVSDDGVERDDNDSVADDMERDGSDTVEDDVASDSMADDTASDSVADDTASDAVGSDHLETLADTLTDTSVEAEPLEGDSGYCKLNMEKHENVAEDLNEEKESLVLKDNVVDEEKAEKGLQKACNKSTGGSSWLQKASWTQLVSDQNTSSFSITQLFPDLSSDKGKAATVINNGDGQHSVSNQSASGMKQTDYTCGSSSGGFMAAGVPVVSTPVRSLEENKQSLKGKNLSEGGRLGARKIINRKIGETCTFMRSSTSLKEWAKAKKELSEPRRRKKSEE